MKTNKKFSGFLYDMIKKFSQRIAVYEDLKFILIFGYFGLEKYAR